MISGSEYSLMSTGTSPEAASRSSKNWTSVSSRAESGMLLTSAILRHSDGLASCSRAPRTDRFFFSAQRAGTRPPDIISGIASLPSYGPSNSCASHDRDAQRLLEIGEDVVDVLDANAEANHFRRYADFRLFLWRQLAVGC